MLDATPKRSQKHLPQDIRTLMDPDRRAPVSQDAFDKLLLDAIVESKLPFMIVQRPKFRRLFEKLAPGRRVMCRSTVRTKVEKDFEEMKLKLKAELAKADWVGTTADAWKSFGR